MEYSTTKQNLCSTPLPKQTDSYKPIGHEELINLTLESVYQAGFALDKEFYSSAGEGQIANAKYTIKNVADSEMQLMIGWQNSYNKSLSLKFAVGTRIFICSNGCVSGDYGAFKKKHRWDVQTFTPSAISSYIKSAGEAFRRIQEERDAMKNVEVTKRVCAELVGRMMIEKEIISSTQLNIIKRELEHPTHNYNTPNSLWELYQFTTFAMKEEHPFTWMKSHIDAHEFFVENSGLIIPKKTIEIVPVNQLELELTP